MTNEDGDLLRDFNRAKQACAALDMDSNIYLVLKHGQIEYRSEGAREVFLQYAVGNGTKSKGRDW